MQWIRSPIVMNLAILMLPSIEIIICFAADRLPGPRQYQTLLEVVPQVVDQLDSLCGTDDDLPVGQLGFEFSLENCYLARQDELSAGRLIS